MEDFLNNNVVFENFEQAWRPVTKLVEENVILPLQVWSTTLLIKITFNLFTYICFISKSGISICWFGVRSQHCVEIK